MSGTGPVEPTDSADFTDPTGPSNNRTRTEQGHETGDIIGDTPPRLSDRWAALPPHTRKAALAAATAGAIATAVLMLPVPPAPLPAPPPDDTPPTPFPANVTAFAYAGPADAATPGTASRSFRFAVSVRRGPPVTLDVTSAAYPGLHAHTTPDTPVTVAAGTTHRITVRISVTDCSGLPLHASLPFLDVTLRNARAIQHHSFIFGGAYSRDLSRLLRTACDTA
ncbi:hypothetical protein [Streptomyces sp. NPDC050704]|uniref:hypothetical protein n=1 Tax=Streptomyces sp. NPDC050704 TaxID=3157219 RepID=UPI00344350AC